MKIDYLFWLAAILLVGTAALRALRSAQRPREGIVWLCGSLIGVVAYLPAQLSFGPDAGMVGWVAALILAIVAAPVHVVVDLTFPLWGSLMVHVGLLGLWAVVAMTAGLYHGLIAVWLGRIYRRRPARALATGVVVLAFNLCLHLLLQEHVIGQRGANPVDRTGKLLSLHAVSENDHSFTPRSRRALAITETELRLMAALAIIGDRRRPKKG